eukprot:gene5967-12036_t
MNQQQGSPRALYGTSQGTRSALGPSRVGQSAFRGGGTTYGAALLPNGATSTQQPSPERTQTLVMTSGVGTGGGISPKDNGRKMSNDGAPEVRPSGLLLPMPSVKSNQMPSRAYDSPPNRQSYPSESRRHVNSRSEYKSTGNGANVGGGGGGGSNTPNSTLMKAGSFLIDKERYAPVSVSFPPQRVGVPSMYPPLQPEQFTNGPLLYNRTANGKMLGSPNMVQIVDPVHVPYREATSALSMLVDGDNKAVGPDRPTKALNETWSACWDGEAGAVYYYNHTTEEDVNVIGHKFSNLKIVCEKGFEEINLLETFFVF